ncbi:unnamed protein product, partial [Mycena citricolor]
MIVKLATFVSLFSIFLLAAGAPATTSSTGPTTTSLTASSSSLTAPTTSHTASSTSQLTQSTSAGGNITNAPFWGRK